MRGLKFRGRPPIRLAASVLDVVGLKDTYARSIMDRSTAIDGALVDAIVGQSMFTWEGRNPSPALDPDGDFIGTDLDLLSFLAPLSERGAVIEFPRYASRRESVIRSNERRISTPSRFGPVVGMTSNQKFFSFSVRLVDNSVIVTDGNGREKPGAFRNFMVVSPSGQWHEGWSQIVFNPTAAENDFLTSKKLWTGNTVYFKNAVHPNRWQSLFGAPYLLLKMLIERLADEHSFYTAKVKELLAAGIRFPVTGNGTDDIVSEPSGALTTKQMVRGLEVELDLPALSGSYPTVPVTQEGLIAASKRVKEIRYTLKPKAQLIVRADELAYFLNGRGRVASWMGSRSFRDYTPPRGRVVWKQMVLSNDVSLRYRERTITDTVVSGFGD